MRGVNNLRTINVTVMYPLDFLGRELDRAAKRQITCDYRAQEMLKVFHIDMGSHFERYWDTFAKSEIRAA